MTAGTTLSPELFPSAPLDAVSFVSSDGEVVWFMVEDFVVVRTR